MQLSPAMIQQLVGLKARADAAGHGGKEALYAEAIAQLGISRATLARRLNQVAVAPARKRRCDAGESALSVPETQLLSAWLMEGFRANNKKLVGIADALDSLRANRPGFATALDGATGELTPLSPSTCARALRLRGLHPDQLRAPAPATPQASLHPNDVWQIDASISTLYYVPDAAPLADMDPAEYYKNKPANFERIARQRLTRYAITDHCSGAIFVRYVAGNESAANLAECFLAALQPREGEPLHGVPFHLVMDPGSAGTAGMTVNLLRRLDVQIVVNKPGNPRAKGQVENAMNLIELGFEHRFKYAPVPSIEWINQRAAVWLRHYNATQVHNRTGITRLAKWMEITQAQLRLVDAELCRTLLTHAPESRKVDTFLQVEFAGEKWSVKGVPGVMVGEKVQVTYNPYDRGAVYIVEHDAHGAEALIAAPRVERDAHGFAVGAPLIGREFKAPADTLADTNRKLVERIATDAATDGEAEAARKAKAVPFGGAIDPYKALENLPAATPLPRRGTEFVPAVRTVAAERLLSRFEAAAELARRGVQMSPERNALVAQWHPEGVPESALDDLQHRLTVRAGLRVVAGGE